MGFGVEGFSTFGVVGGRFLNFFKDFTSYEIVRACWGSQSLRVNTQCDHNEGLGKGEVFGTITIKLYAYFN
jgi:hypothetical protein